MRQPNRKGASRVRDLKAFVTRHTEIASAPLVPEMRLRLATDPRAIFPAADTFLDGGLGSRPYWAFAWPGGQGLARYLLDNPATVRGKRVLDIGSGSGIGVIAVHVRLAIAATEQERRRSRARSQGLRHETY